jgi:hypothetical protein
LKKERLQIKCLFRDLLKFEFNLLNSLNETTLLIADLAWVFSNS